MLATQCDRCGALYERRKNQLFKLFRVSEKKSKYQRAVDLCPDCEKELGQWFDKMVIRGGTKHD